MEDLNFPIFKENLPKSKSLSMYEYYQFILFNLKTTFNREEYNKNVLERRTTVPFRLEE